MYKMCKNNKIIPDMCLSIEGEYKITHVGPEFGFKKITPIRYINDRPISFMQAIEDRRIIEIITQVLKEENEKHIK